MFLSPPSDQDWHARLSSMVLDIVGPDNQPLPERHEPLLGAIAQAAADTDRLGVPRSRFADLAAAGLLGRPLQPPSQQRELAERLFWADGSLTFCWLQHQSPLKRLLAAASTPEAPAADGLRRRWLEPVARGTALAAVASAHLRRPGPPNPRATPIPGGWRLEGQLDWITSWDIADLTLLCLRCREVDRDRVVGLLLPAEAPGSPLPPGLKLGEPLRLLAMGGTHTRPAELDGVEVSERQVLFLDDYPTWLQADAATACRVNPVVFGCVRGALADLQQMARRQDDGLDLAGALAQECRQLRRDAYRLIDANPADSPELRQHHRRLRAHALNLAMRAAQAAVIVQGGAAMYSGTAAARRLREASFLLVQAQTAESRQASLKLLFPDDVMPRSGSLRSSSPPHGPRAQAALASLQVPFQG
jgi:alkylation response protein AidB-like acyl-CoA dehydrogenase